MKAEIQQLNTLPTGYLFTTHGERGELETLSIGDYGKRHNIKADFLGFTEEINGVPNVACMPLSEKWVITLSTQYGCPQKCTFCQVPEIPFRGNASFEDLKKQLMSAVSLFPEVRYTDRLNVHFARMGEPILNENVFEFARWMALHKMDMQRETGVRFEVIHPVLTTSLPRRFKHTESRLVEWLWIKNHLYRGQAGLQISVNSTNESQRQQMFGNESITLADFARIAERFEDPLGRKYCLNFAYASDFEVDGKLLASMFDPEKWMCKITPIHNNEVCVQNGIKMIDGYTSYNSYRKPEESLKEAGFDVLVFVPSMDEEHGLVTCGNLVIGGSKFKEMSTNVVNIEGITNSVL